MKSKLLYLGVIMACVSLFSFKEVCNDNDGTCVKQNVTGQCVPACVERENEEWKFSPLYNFLKI